MSNEEDIKQQIDLIQRLNGYGSHERALTDNLRGINVNLNGVPAPINRDSFGITFFTRPDLNLSYNNIVNDRLLTNLLNTDPNSMATAIRVMLDPRLQKSSTNPIESNLIDEHQAFIPILTNNLVSMSGWPDLMVDTFTSKSGRVKEDFSIIDDTSHIYYSTDITASFANIQGDPITFLFAIWVRYASLVYEGKLVPYVNNLMQNTIDYQTRIYRLVLNADWTHVQKIAACGAAFPKSAPLGNAFNYSDKDAFNEENNQMSISFRITGVDYLDPITIKEFNYIVERFNPSMKDGTRGSAYEKISFLKEYVGHGFIGPILSNVLNHRVYPRIDPITLELEWYASKDDFDSIIAQLTEFGVLD